MVDHISPERRSWLMARVASKHTGPEMRVRQVAHAMGLRYRLHRKDLPGKPDMVFPQHRVVLFVHGCFWHRHPECPKASNPKTRSKFWQDKFSRNVERDIHAQLELEKSGWRIAVIWECETRNSDFLKMKISSIFSSTKGDDGG